MNHARVVAAATLLPNGKVLVEGGKNDQIGERLASAEVATYAAARDFSFHRQSRQRLKLRLVNQPAGRRSIFCSSVASMCALATGSAAPAATQGSSCPWWPTTPPIKSAVRPARTLPDGTLNLHPGFEGENAVLGWTAPASGTRPSVRHLRPTSRG
jgi:hypothetical protein